MPATKPVLIRLLWIATLTTLVACSMSCASPRSQVTVIPADRMIRKLDNGNYEVTPAWLQERYQLERWQAEKLKECK